MFEYIQGVIKYIYPTYIVIENQGIGYKVHVPNPYYFQDNIGNDQIIYIEQVVREDAMTLFGFPSSEEKELFLRLNQVTNIGPKTALSILAVDDHEGLIRAITEGDSKYLMNFPGVGKKTAQQMILDLQDKIEPSNATAQKPSTYIDNTIYDETLEALRGLGYSQREITRVEKAFKDATFDNTQEALSFAFKLLIKS